MVVSPLDFAQVKRVALNSSLFLSSMGFKFLEICKTEMKMYVLCYRTQQALMINLCCQNITSHIMMR